MVTIKRPTLRDAEEFLRAVHRNRPLHKGLVSPPGDLEAYRRYINTLRQRNRVGFVVIHDGTKELAGVINVNEIVLGAFRSAYLGYYAFAPYAGRGLMREGMQKVIDHCFRELRLHRLEANIQPENTRSICLVQGLGFQKEGYSPRYLKVCGRWRDHERWAIRSSASSISSPRKPPGFWI